MGWPNNYAEYTYDTNGNVVGLDNIKVSRVLANSTLPIGLPSSGSVTSAGVLTMSTAFSQVTPYAHVWLYFPANTIASGLKEDGTTVTNAAGFYYCRMSSTTVGDVYTNYIPTTTSFPATSEVIPYIPTSPTPVIATTTGGVTVNYTTPVATIIPCVAVKLHAGSIGNNGEVTARVLWSNNNTNGIKVSRFGLGSMLLMGSAATTSTQQGYYASFRNRGVNNIQYSQNATFGDFSSAGVSNITTINTGVDQYVAVSAQIAIGADTINTNCIIESACFEAFTMP